jgi:hypothetical protein
MNLGAPEIMLILVILALIFGGIVFAAVKRGNRSRRDG